MTGLFGLVQPLVDRAFRLGKHLGQRNVPEDAGQDVVEIVRDTPRQQTQRLQLARLLHFSFQLAVVRDVAKYQHRADFMSAMLVDRRAGHDDNPFDALAGNQQRRRAAADRRFRVQYLRDRTTQRLAAVLIEQAKHLA